ncbi:hypothetical protein [Mycolicibacterium mengxianglii]|uniref:hypothetical protein n=1 Tax=Mycolicibacterium mengxianglii TaxID=2736649 RepID=UPI0018EEF08A|nr:hypothetical protein [Mycolicibacterium mengxianglii]
MRQAVFSAGYRLLSVLLASILAVTLVAPGMAHAEPVPGEDVSIRWTELGLPADVTLLGANTNQDFTVAVPSGFEVRRLRGLIHAPVEFGAGFVEITNSRGALLATVDLPAVIPSQAVVPFDVDIAGAQTDRDTAFLSFTVRTAEVAVDRCGQAQQLTLSDLSTTYAGNETAPTTIASFFPSVLQQVTVYAPIDADSAEQQAVLALTSAIARMYRPQSPAITVVDQPRGTTPPPAPRFARAVVVERGDAAISVVNPGSAEAFLKLAGRGDQLTDQASLVVNQLQSVVQVATARVDLAGHESPSGSDQMTFEQLGLGGESQVMRTADFTVGVDRSALGGRVEGLQVHLLAAYTPVAAADAATVMVRVNGQSVYTSALDSTGRVDAVFDVPGAVLRQRINLGFDLTFSPRQLCTPTTAPLTFQLDPRSTVTMRRGGPAPGGFGAVPSEFSPEFLVALDGSSPDQLDFASQVVADISRRTSTTLMPRVVDVTAAADATTGALIVANAATVKLTSLRPPIDGENSDVVVDLGKEFRAQITDGVGSIQVFADRPRDRTVILVTTNGAWSLVEPLFGHIDRLPDGWSSLAGDVLAAGPEGTVVDLSLGSADTASPADHDRPGWPLWAALGGVAVVALAVGIALWWRRRRSGLRSP